MDTSKPRLDISLIQVWSQKAIVAQGSWRSTWGSKLQSWHLVHLLHWIWFPRVTSPATSAPHISTICAAWSPTWNFPGHKPPHNHELHQLDVYSSHESLTSEYYTGAVPSFLHETPGNWLNLDLMSSFSDLKLWCGRRFPISPGLAMEVLRAYKGNRRQLLCPHISGTYL